MPVKKHATGGSLFSRFASRSASDTNPMHDDTSTPAARLSPAPSHQSGHDLPSFPTKIYRNEREGKKHDDTRCEPIAD